MSTNEAFEAMIGNHAIGRVLGISSSQVRNYRHLYKTGRLSEKRKIRLLQAAGFQLVQEPKWAYPIAIKR